MPYTTLRYAGRCHQCGQSVPVRAEAWWDPDQRAITCAGCRPRTRTQNSARTFAISRAENYRQRTKATWGPLSPLVLLLRPDDRDTRVARKGADGEERLTGFLNTFARTSTSPVGVLHDRGIPGRRENIDHMVVTTAGIWAVDAKAYAGTITVPLLRRDRLWIGGRDQAKLLAQSHRQQDFIRDALGRLGLPDLPVHGALCFLDAQMGLLVNGIDVGGVTVCTPRRLARELNEPGTLSSEQVEWVTHRLTAWFTLSN